MNIIISNLIVRLTRWSPNRIKHQYRECTYFVQLNVTQIHHRNDGGFYDNEFPNSTVYINNPLTYQQQFCYSLGYYVITELVENIWENTYNKYWFGLVFDIIISPALLLFPLHIQCILILSENTSSINMDR